MTAAGVINQVRYKLKDIVTGAYKWSDTELLDYVSDGQREIFKYQPESIISGTTITATFTLTDITATTDTLEIMDRYMPQMVDYVLSRALDKIDTSMAMIYNAKFYKSITP